MKKTIEVEGLADSSIYSYSQCIVANGLIFVAGQTGVDENYNVVSTDFEPQARQALLNTELGLKAAGAGWENVVSMTVYLTDLANGRDFLRVRGEVMGDTLSTSAMIGCAALALPELQIEIVATAVEQL